MQRLVGLCVISSVLACACQQRSPVTPTPAVRHDVQTVRVVSGVGDQAPVVGAAVTIAGSRYVTDANGEVHAPPGGSFQLDSDADVEAPGFLLRQTRIPTERSAMALWPVANDAEADAVHQMVYGDPEPDRAFPPGPGPFPVTFADATAEERAAWMAEAEEFGRRFGISYYFSRSRQYDAGEVEVFVEGRDGRNTYACTPDPLLGLCRADSPYRIFIVEPNHILDGTTIRHVLAGGFLRGANPLPGLLNVTAPAQDLSELERNAIAMLLIRKEPLRWPDNDR